MTSMTPFITLIVYMLVIIWAVTRYGRLKDESLEEYAVAGRSFPWFFMVFTVLGSWYPGDTFAAVTGTAVFSGAWCMYMFFYSLIGAAFFYFIAPRVWIWGKTHGLVSMPDYIKSRYDSKALATIFAVAITMLGWVWLMTGFKMTGYVMYEVSYHAIPFNVGVYIIPVFVMVYILIGGMRSIVVTDLIQGIISTVIVIFGIVFVIQKLFGGAGAMFAQLIAEKPDEWLTISGPNEWSSTLIACGLGAYCWLEEFNRIFVAKSPKDLKKVARLVPIIIAFFGISLTILALGGGLLPEVTASQASAESAILIMFSKAGGPIFLAFAGIIVITASMSNMDSLVNANAVAIAKNVIGDNVKAGISDQTTVLITRIITVVSVLACAWWATADIPLIATLMITTYEFLLCFFAGIILGVFWKRGSALGTYISLAVGIPTVVLLLLNDSWLAAFHGFAPGLIGGTFSIVAYLIVGLVREPSDHIESLFSEVDKYEMTKS